jgi:sterol desaturase/sphingolipid hydroxylase (fatty acid hydroxylase superfamily)
LTSVEVQIIHSTNWLNIKIAFPSSIAAVDRKRFHPIEIILSMLIKFTTIMVLGPPLVAVTLFEVILNVMAMFNHGNVRLPTALDRMLRWLIVTPDMHRVHHSVEDDEANSNFGFNLSCWDRLPGT